MEVNHDVESIIHHHNHQQILVDCWPRLLCLGSPAVPDIGRNGAGSFGMLAQLCGRLGSDSPNCCLVGCLSDFGLPDHKSKPNYDAEDPRVVLGETLDYVSRDQVSISELRLFVKSHTQTAK
jgi:hypothetical protein